MSRLKEQYVEKIVPSLLNEFKYGNQMQVPKLKTIVLSMGLGRAIQDKKLLELAHSELTKIAGQKPLICKARKSVSNFKLREGMDIGLKVTLRKQRMYEFLDRLINLAIPRVRDFRGLSPKGFDGHGNFSMGLNEIVVFPEVDHDKVTQPLGMNITMVTTANTDQEAKQLLKLFGMPYKTDGDTSN